MSEPAASRRAGLESLFAAALAHVHAGRALSRCVGREADGALRLAGSALLPDARLVVISIGKAAAVMARALEDVAAERIRTGLVVTKDGHGQAGPRAMRVCESGHPVPDARCERAGRACLELAAATRAGEILVVLLSGGASALTACPAPGVSLEDLAHTTQLLLACGADIEELNCVRKHLSAVAGGQLARAARCHRVELLAVSDVPGDRLDVIGSGPCHADPTHFCDALAVVERYALRARLRPRILARLEAGVRGECEETLEPGDEALAGVRARIVACNRDARRAVLERARRTGLRAIDLGEVLLGEAREVGRRLVGLARGIETRDPLLLVAGGETTVTLRGRGRGGRNQELALAAALELERRSATAGRPSLELTLLAAGSDGGDGPTSAAGGCVDALSCARARRAGLDPQRALRENDSHPLLRAADALVTTGPTATNVMDLALLRLQPRDAGAR